MSRLSQLLLILMIALSTLCALEPAFATTDRSETSSVSIAEPAAPDQTDSSQHDKLPPCHVCCGSKLPAMISPALAVRMPIRSIDIVSPAPRLAGLTVSPGSRPPRA